MRKQRYKGDHRMELVCYAFWHIAIYICYKGMDLMRRVDGLEEMIVGGVITNITSPKHCKLPSSHL